MLSNKLRADPQRLSRRQSKPVGGGGGGGEGGLGLRRKTNTSLPPLKK